MAIGFGCMRLSTAPDRDESNAIAVIHAALDAGATLLDTADVYCHDETDVGHNERLIARALESWPGERAAITVATKGGLRRPKGQWINDARAKHLKDACDASRAALGVDRVDLYQLHVVDPKVDITTSVRALAALQAQGKIRDIGLCNVTVSQIESARAVADISSVQVSLSVFDDDNLRNGVAEYCRDHGIRLIAHRPLGGERAKRLTRQPVLSRIAEKHGVTAADAALAWLCSFDADVVPVPGATRVETARALAAAIALRLDDEDRQALDAAFSGRLFRLSRAQRRPSSEARNDGEVVIVMGVPGAGKTTLARDLEQRGYERLNRDSLGGSLADLVPRVDESLARGTRRVVLDNTYPSRASRNAVIETAWAHGLTARCVWLTTSIADAQINAIHRMIDTHGALPTPAEIRAKAPNDPRYFLPDAQFRYERMLEAPSVEEGFESVDEVSFVCHDGATESQAHRTRALILDADLLVAPAMDDVAHKRHARLAHFHGDGWRLFAHAWRPRQKLAATTPDDLATTFARLRDTLGIAIDLFVCEHEAGPPACWCRKPIPGPVIDFARRNAVALAESIVVGAGAADRTMAERLGAQFHTPEQFFDD